MVQFVAAPPKAIVLDSWMQRTACFKDAMGQLPQFEVLRRPEMIALCQSNRDVNNLVSLVGEVYLTQKKGPQSFSRRHEKLRQRTDELTDLFSRQIGQPRGKWSNAPVACGILLFTINVSEVGGGPFLMTPILMSLQLIVYSERDPNRSWVSDISTYIAETTKNEPGLSSFDADLIRMTQTCDLINSVTRMLRPSITNFASSMLLHEELPQNKLGSLPPYVLLGEHVDFMLSALWQWAALQRRCVTVSFQVFCSEH
jgi:hypothetical protein